MISTRWVGFLVGLFLIPLFQIWSSNLEHYTKYNMEGIMPVVVQLAEVLLLLLHLFLFPFNSCFSSFV